MSKEFSKNLRKYRELAGYKKAKDFSDVLEMNYASYIAYENKDREPRYDALCQIADLLHVTTDELLGHVVDKQGEYERCKAELQRYGFEVKHADTEEVVVIFSSGEDMTDGRMCEIYYDNQKSFINSVKEIADKIKKEHSPSIRFFLQEWFKKEYYLQMYRAEYPELMAKIDKARETKDFEELRRLTDTVPIIGQMLQRVASLKELEKVLHQPFKVADSAKPMTKREDLLEG